MSYQYDYIIAGAGCAGRSLAVHLLPLLQEKQQTLLLVDISFNHLQNKTWCYWETGTGIFEPIIYQQWDHLSVISQDEKITLDISPYQYKMIRSADFYAYTQDLLSASPQVTLLSGNINYIGNKDTAASIIIDDREYNARYVFNSLPTTIRQQQRKYSYLLQHFKGWKIKTSQPAFNPSEATLMDFSIPQTTGTEFVYMLPVSEDTAMIEYTVFSATTLQESEYKNKLTAYIKHHLGISAFMILEEESGIIPMTDHPFPTTDRRIIPIGTTGGMTKPSSGYTFNFIQKHCRQITNAILNNTTDFHLPVARRFELYDGTLLKVLSSNPAAGAGIFTTMFKTSPPQRILRFLDNNSTLLDEYKLFISLPVFTFLKAFIRKLSAGLKRN